MRVRDSLLALLARAPAHGYQLKLDYERLTRNGQVNIGQIYQTLERLQRDGLVEREPGDPDDRRITYHLTSNGRNDAHELFRTTTDLAPGNRSAIATKILFAAEIPDLDVVEILDAQRIALLQNAQTARRDMRGRQLSVVERLGIEAELAVVEAELRWLDLCEEELGGAR